MLGLWYGALIAFTISSSVEGDKTPYVEGPEQPPNCLPGTEGCTFTRRKRAGNPPGHLVEACPHSAQNCASFYDCPEVVEMLRSDNDTVVKLGQLRYCGKWEPYGPLVCCHQRLTRRLPEFSKDYPKLPVERCGYNNMHLMTNDSYSYLESEPPHTTDCEHYRKGKRDTAYQKCLSRKAKLTSRREKRLIGGRPARIGQWPWLAAIFFAYTNYDSISDTDVSPSAFGCVGSIINKRYIISSSYCIFEEYNDNGLSPHFVIVGLYKSYNTTRKADNQDIINDLLYTLDPKPQRISVEKNIWHEEFREAYWFDNAYTNDIGLIRLGEDIKYNDFVQPICLPTSEAPSEVKSDSNENYIMVSFSSDPYYAYKFLPRTMNVVPVSQADCNEKYSKYFARKVELDYNKVFCVARNTDEGLCSQDIGAPIMRAAPDGRMFLMGIAAEVGQLGCRIADIPELVTKVEPYMPWLIRSMTEAEG